jgi:SpoVK/Ycf46/Vps4 family AAA+-type ATPase
LTLKFKGLFAVPKILKGEDIVERRLYKVGLSVNFKREVDFEKNFEKLIIAAQDFSEKSKYKKVLTISDIEQDMIYFLIAFSSNRVYEKFTLRAVISFLKELCLIFGLQYESKKNYFTLEECIALSEEEYLKLLTQSSIYAGTRIKEANKQKEEQDCEAEEFDDSIRIPKRKFPVLISGNPRSSGSDKKEDDNHTTFNAALEQLNALVGIGKVKEEIKKITNFIIRNNERCVRLNIDNPGLYYNTVIMGNKGTGKDTIAKIIYKIYSSLGVIGKGKLINVDSKDIWPGCSLDRQIGNAQSGVVLINDAHLISINDRRGTKDNFTTLDEWFSVYKDNFVFIIAGEAEGMKELMKNEMFKKHIDFSIDIPDFNEQESLNLIRCFAEKEKYIVDDKAESVLTDYIKALKRKGIFENAYTAKRIVESAIIEKGALGSSDYLTEDDFKLEVLSSTADNNDKEGSPETDPFEELEGMIGMEEIKDKVKELAAYTETQLRRKKLGLRSEPLCLHMNFVGNPGTGKTSVARCIGKILKKIGVLSTGKFVEAAREDLCGKYVGHTAVKTSEKIKEAEGGVLFIDEAYSLNSDSKVDYGYEAVNTLVKKMEDLRDNLVVIFAGYPKEMSRFINMNPGLKDRIQFKLEFVDYKPDELLEIWKKFFADHGYEVDSHALKTMEEITVKLYENRDSSFSNGRIMRKCFERVKMQQAVRIASTGLTEVDELTRITPEDIKSLYKDRDMAELLEYKGTKLKKCIGFVR